MESGGLFLPKASHPKAPFVLAWLGPISQRGGRRPNCYWLNSTWGPSLLGEKTMAQGRRRLSRAVFPLSSKQLKVLRAALREA